VRKPSHIFEATYRDYLKQIGQVDLQALAKKTGLEIQEGGLILPFFGKPYRSSAQGIVDASGEEPVHSVKVVLCKYILLYPSVEPQNREWVSYKDFKGAAPFVDGFQKNTERVIARNFGGKLEVLAPRIDPFGGQVVWLEGKPDLKRLVEELNRLAGHTGPVYLISRDHDLDAMSQVKSLLGIMGV